MTSAAVENHPRIILPEKNILVLTKGFLLIDNSRSRRAIDEKTVMLLSVVAHAVGVAINNTKAYSSVLRDSIHDDLTGLHNRRYFNERLIDEVERAHRYGSKVSMLFVRYRSLQARQ